MAAARACSSTSSDVQPARGHTRHGIALPAFVCASSTSSRAIPCRVRRRGGVGQIPRPRVREVGRVVALGDLAVDAKVLRFDVVRREAPGQRTGVQRLASQVSPRALVHAAQFLEDLLGRELVRTGLGEHGSQVPEEQDAEALCLPPWIRYKRYSRYAAAGRPRAARTVGHG